MKFPTTVGLLSSRGQRHRSGSNAKAPPASKRRPAPSGLSQDELLAKIDALDWDRTASPGAAAIGDTAPAASVDREPSRGWWLAAAIVSLICVAAVTYHVLTPVDPPERSAVAQAAKAIAAPPERSADSPSVAPEAMTEGMAAVVAADERRAKRYEQAENAAELDLRRKAERARQAREARQAERAKNAAQQKEHERRQREDAARLRAQREAAEAARPVAAPVRESATPKGPASPREACAGEGNFFSRGLCEARLCGQSEWRAHPQCVKRIDDQLRALNPGN